MRKGLSKVVRVIEDKCVSCHACVRACPVRFCNDGSGDHVTINDNMCIGCGQCIKACKHGARVPVDDFDSFLADLKRGKNIIAIVAPAVASRFPNSYLNLNGWLNSIGVEAFFDVSFGAELTVKSYLNHILTNKPKCVIAQPCPAIVTFIQIYKPELIPYLAPADSPMLHSAKMIREFYPDYANAKIAVISPCMAKRREFDETGLGDYNVTIGAIQNYLTDNKIRIESFPKIEYTNPPAERAVLFSTPGGLLKTVERWVPEAAEFTRKIEGPEIVYHYLETLHDSIKKGMAPQLIDILNCEAGCNGGTAVGGSSDDIPIDQLDSLVEKRRKETCQKYIANGPFSKVRTAKKLEKLVNKYWRPQLYSRTYENLHELNEVENVSSKDIQKQYERLHKLHERDFYDCGACGYDSCEEMAKAMSHNLSKPTNCYHYTQNLLMEISESFDQNTNELAATVEEISSTCTQMHGHSKSVAEFARNANFNAETMKSQSQKGLDAIYKIQQAMVEIKESSHKTAKILKSIDDIAFQTNLLALNAAVEAARAGHRGRGFAVVAEEVRNLAGKSANAAKDTEVILNEMIQSGESGIVVANETRQLFDQMANLIDTATDSSTKISENTTEQTMQIGEINTALESISQKAQENASKAAVLKAKIQE